MCSITEPFTVIQIPVLEKTVPGQYLVKSLHVQDRGVFELHSTDKKLTSRLSLTNLTVSAWSMCKQSMSSSETLGTS